MRTRPKSGSDGRDRRDLPTRRTEEYATRLDRRKEEDRIHHHDGPEQYALKR